MRKRRSCHWHLRLRQPGRPNHYWIARPANRSASFASSYPSEVFCRICFRGGSLSGTWSEWTWYLWVGLPFRAKILYWLWMSYACLGCLGLERPPSWACQPWLLQFLLMRPAAAYCAHYRRANSISASVQTFADPLPPYYYASAVSSCSSSPICFLSLSIQSRCFCWASSSNFERKRSG